MKRGNPETELAELETIFRSVPDNMIERYMETGKGPWTRWAVRFMDFYGRCSLEERAVVVDAFMARFAKMKTELPPSLHMIEILWDFGGGSAAFSELPRLFHDVMQRYQGALEPEQFQSLVVNRLRGGGIIPHSEWSRYDAKQEIPSRETQIRLHNVETDIQRERRLLEKHQLPDDADDMTHMLKKMKKAKMGLPHWPEFLARVHEKFQASPDWTDIQREIDKIREKFPEWAAAQIEIATAVQSEIR